MLRVSQYEHIIKINNNMKTLVMAKEQYGFDEQGENPKGCSQPKMQNHSLVRSMLPNKL